MARDLENTRAELAAVRMNLDKAHSDQSKVCRGCAVQQKHDALCSELACSASSCNILAWLCAVL